MDKWKRSRNGVLVNDDAAGYENARRRVALKTQRRNEMEEMKERITALEARAAETEKTLVEIVALCKSLANAIKR